MQSEHLIQSLMEQTKLGIIQVERLKNFDRKTLIWRQNASSWNILECLEHLNRYGDFYLPQLEDKIKRSTTTSETHFKSGLLGGYFAKSMLSKEKLNKIKTFKDKNPLHATLDETVIEEFIRQEIKLLDLLNQSKKVSLNKVKIQTSISHLISLKLGDTFQFFINHIARHLKQIENIQSAIKSETQLQINQIQPPS